MSRLRRDPRDDAGEGGSQAGCGGRTMTLRRSSNTTRRLPSPSTASQRWRRGLRQTGHGFWAVNPRAATSRFFCCRSVAKTLHWPVKPTRAAASMASMASVASRRWRSPPTRCGNPGGLIPQEIGKEGGAECWEDLGVSKEFRAPRANRRLWGLPSAGLGQEGSKIGGQAVELADRGWRSMRRRSVRRFVVGKIDAPIPAQRRQNGKRPRRHLSRMAPPSHLLDLPIGRFARPCCSRSWFSAEREDTTGHAISMAARAAAGVSAVLLAGTSGMPADHRGHDGESDHVGQGGLCQPWRNQAAATWPRETCWQATPAEEPNHHRSAETNGRGEEAPVVAPCLRGQGGQGCCRNGGDKPQAEGPKKRSHGGSSSTSIMEAQSTRESGRRYPWRFPEEPPVRRRKTHGEAMAAAQTATPMAEKLSATV